MPIRKGNAEWNGGLKNGKGHVRTETKVLDAAYNFSSRFEEGEGTNPEELIGAAHAGCFSMALSGALEKDGYKPESIKTEARVHIERGSQGFAIPKIELFTEANVPEIDEDKLHEHAEGAKKNCPVSKLLTGANITVSARLVQETGS